MYVQDPSFDKASDVAATFRELLTRHKSTIAEFLSKYYDWLNSLTHPRLQPKGLGTERVALLSMNKGNTWCLQMGKEKRLARVVCTKQVAYGLDQP